MIPFSYVDGQMLSRLDAEGSDAYGLNQDRIHWVNGSQHILQSTMTSLLEAKKFSGEALRDVNYTTVFQTSHFGQIAIDTLLPQVTMPSVPSQIRRDHKLWTVVAVFPEFNSAAPATITADTNPTRSQLRQDVEFVSPIKAAKHYTAQQWAAISKDPFSPGNTVLMGSLKEYGYLFGTRSVSTGRAASFLPLTVVPYVAGQRQLVAVSYLKVPYDVPEMPLEEADPLYNTVQLEWPDSMAELIITIALRIASIKQGDGTRLNGLTAQEMSMLLNANA